MWSKAKTSSTNCKKIVINRSGNIGQFVNNELGENGVCPYCSYKLEGKWK
ncbi:MAG: pyruvate formate lyase activating enzyme [Sulfurimonas sp.]|jgi:pyruvate formate lyase activating enzyme